LKAFVVLNARGGSMARRDAAKVSGEIGALFHRHGIDATVAAVGGGDIVPLIRGAIAKPGDSGNGYDAIVIGGGDGSVSAAASVMAGTDVPLGVLPLGTLNHFAKDLRLPLDMEEAVAVIARGNVREVDVGVVNGRIFVNNASLGLYPHLVEERERARKKGVAKWLAAGMALARVLWRMPRPRVTVRAEGWKAERRSPCLFIGNNLYKLDAFASAQRARLDRGELCLYIAAKPGRAAFLKLAARTLLGRMQLDRDLELVRLLRVEIAARRSRMRVALDGEALVMAQPLKFEIRPRALKVFAPESELEKKPGTDVA
jgi:diacylglycerol kinase family enzyme